MLRALIVAACFLPLTAQAQEREVDVHVHVYVQGGSALPAPPPSRPAPSRPAPSQPAAEPAPAPVLIPAYTPPPLPAVPSVRLREPLRMQAPRRSYGWAITSMAAGGVMAMLGGLLYAESGLCYGYGGSCTPDRELLIPTLIGTGLFAFGTGMLIRRIRRFRRARAAYRRSLRATAW